MTFRQRINWMVYDKSYGIKTMRAWAVIVLALIGTVILTGIIALGSMRWDEHVCSEYGEATGYETGWSMWTGCLVTTDDGVFLRGQVYYNEGN